MSYRTKIVLTTLCLLSALNVVALVLNLSWPAGAAVRGMSYQDLMRDPDFTRAAGSLSNIASTSTTLPRG